MLGVDEQGSPHHDLLRDADRVDGMPVVVADLHSALPAVLAGLQSAGRPGTVWLRRAAYVMYDAGRRGAARVVLPHGRRHCARRAGWRRR